MNSEPPRARLLPILIVNSHVSDAIELALALSAQGFETHIVGTDEAALAELQLHYFATLIVYLNPKRSIWIERLLTLRRAATRSWILAVTSHQDADVMEKVYRHGGDACLSAPVAVDALIARLDAFQLRGRPLV